MAIEINNESCRGEFIRLNEIWIKRHIALEDADRKLAADPCRIVRDGDHILSLVEAGRLTK